MRIATFNVEKLFNRPAAKNLPTWKEGQPALDAAAELNALFNKETYSAADKKRMLKLLGNWGLLATRGTNKFLCMRKTRGSLVRTSKGESTVIANGRNDWVGWIELKTDTIKYQAIEPQSRSRT